jgi:DNA replication protein DnaC
MVISSPFSLGKTCLATAPFVAPVGDEGVGLPIEYNALMRAVLQQMDLPDGKPDAAVMLAASVPVLFIDDLGNTFLPGRETPGRQRWLFEILNHRYNERLPLIVTTNLAFEDLASQFDEKLAQRLLEYALWLDVSGPSLRLKGR